jgi:ADP-heptose:LPS heptosyltransferase
MAAAFGLPVVAIFGPSDEKVWAPWRTASQVLKGRTASEVPLGDVLAAMARLRVNA